MTSNPVAPQNYNPRKFVVWLFIIASIMLFAAFTSGFVVRKAQGNWLHYSLPSLLIWSTSILLISSGTLYWAVRSVRLLKIKQERIALIVTLVLGLLFLSLQWEAWKMLVKEGVYWVGNPSGSFFYVISGFHAVHVLAGLGLVTAALSGSFATIHPAENLFRLQVASIFWHFLDILWVYLYVFLLLNQ